MKRLMFGALVGCALLLVPCRSFGLEVSDFIRMDGAQTWQVEGASGSFSYTGTITSQVVKSAFEPEQDSIQFSVWINGGYLTITHDLILRLTEETLFLESRASSILVGGEVFDSETEIYEEPAAILPRLFSMNTEYPYTAVLSTETVEDAVLIGDFESKTTTQGWEVEALRVDFFTKDDRPLVIWFGRDIGFIELLMKVHFYITDDYLLTLVADPATWNPEPGSGMWEDTINLGGGWRGCEAIGTIWVPSIDSPWVSHYGLDWIYCTGDDTSMFSYIPGIDWIWTQCGMYPILWVYSGSGWMYYPEEPGNRILWDYTANDWVDLGPAP